jgi:hypothetical protein
MLASLYRELTSLEQRGSTPRRGLRTMPATVHHNSIGRKTVVTTDRYGNERVYKFNGNYNRMDKKRKARHMRHCGERPDERSLQSER